MKLFAIFAVLLMLTLPVQAQQMPELHRGINLASWLGNAPRQPLFSRDLAQIKRAGFDHVRLPFNPEFYGFKLAPQGGGAARMDFIPLDRAVALAEQYDLPVIIDIHVEDAFTQTLERHAWAEKDFIDLWKTIAEHYRSHPGASVIFELLNEPQYYKSEDLWNKLAHRAVKAIRVISPDRIIIVGAPHGSEIDGLPFLKTTNDPHIIYSFHFYEPYMISLQGVHMGFEDRMLRYFRHVPYPSSLATQTAAIYAPNAPRPAQAQQELDDYVKASWDADHIATRIHIARDWAAQHHVRVIAGEFGAMRVHIDADSRYRWINDVRTALDSDHIGWELWDYSDLCGIAPPSPASAPDPVDGAVMLTDLDKGSRHIEPQALTALGLTAATP